MQQLVLTICVTLSLLLCPPRCAEYRAGADGGASACESPPVKRCACCPRKSEKDSESKPASNAPQEESQDDCLCSNFVCKGAVQVADSSDPLFASLLFVDLNVSAISISADKSDVDLRVIKDAGVLITAQQFSLAMRQSWHSLNACRQRVCCATRDFVRFAGRLIVADFFTGSPRTLRASFHARPRDLFEKRHVSSLGILRSQSDSSTANDETRDSEEYASLSMRWRYWKSSGQPDSLEWRIRHRR